MLTRPCLAIAALAVGAALVGLAEGPRVSQFRATKPSTLVVAGDAILAVPNHSLVQKEHGPEILYRPPGVAETLFLNVSDRRKYAHLPPVPRELWTREGEVAICTPQTFSRCHKPVDVAPVVFCRSRLTPSDVCQASFPLSSRGLVDAEIPEHLSEQWGRISRSAAEFIERLPAASLIDVLQIKLHDYIHAIIRFILYLSLRFSFLYFGY